MNSPHTTHSASPPLAVFAVALVVAFGTASCCEAGLSFTGYDWSWSKTSDNGQYIFVCLFSEPIDEQIVELHKRSEDPPDFTHAEVEEQIRRLHETYPQTGMYRNDGSAKPLWIPGDEVWFGRPSPDGSRLIDVDTDYGIGINVYEPNSPVRRIGEFEIIGYPAVFLYWVAINDRPYIEGYDFDKNWEHLTVAYENRMTATVRLDDFAVVQSNVLPNAIATLFTTPRGIAFVLFFLAFCWGILWAVSRCWLWMTRRAR